MLVSLIYSHYRFWNVIDSRNILRMPTSLQSIAQTQPSTSKRNNQIQN